jgi:hypothetical protein
LASDFSEILGKDQNYFQSDPNAQTLSAKVRGLLDIATKTGFPTPQGALEQLADFVNGIISAVWSLITAVWDAIVNFVGSVANFLLAVWNNIVGPVLGSAIEVVKNVVNLAISQVENIIQTILIASNSNPNLEIISNNIFNSNFVDIYSPFLGENFSNVDLSLGSFGSTLSDIVPILNPLLDASSLGSLITNVLGIPSEIGFIIDMLGANALYSIVMESISFLINKILDNFIAGISIDAIESIKSSLSQLLYIFPNEYLEYIDPVLIQSQSQTLSIQSFDQFQSIDSESQSQSSSSSNFSRNPLDPLFNPIEDVFKGILTSILNILNVVKEIPSIKSLFLSVLAITSLIIPNIPNILVFFIPTIASVNTNLIFSFIYQLMSSFMSIVANKIGSYIDINLNHVFIQSGVALSNAVYLIIEGFFDIVALHYSYLSWYYMQVFTQNFPNDFTMSHLGNFATTFVLNMLGELVEDIGKLIVFGIGDIYNLDMNYIYTIGKLFIATGFSLKLLANGFYFAKTLTDKIFNRPEIFINPNIETLGMVLTLGSSIIFM